MPNRSGCLTTLLIFIALLNLAGLYLMIDSQSRFTQALAINTEQLNRLENKLDRLCELPKGTPSPTETASASEGASPTLDNFANSEFRQPQAEYGGRRVSSTSTFSGNFNAIVQNESSTSDVWGLCNDQLADRNLMRPQEFQPVLAESWNVSPDGLIYDIKLRKGVTWHPFTDPVSKKVVAAKEVTADDFVFFWETINNPDVPCEPQRVYFQSLKSIKATGSHSLRITWKEPYSKSEEISLTLSPLPRHYYRPNLATTDKEFAEEMKSGARNQFVVGCGPFRFAEYKPNESLRLERYEDYYGPKPYVKSLLMKVIPEPSVAFLELKKGGIDEMALQPEQWVKEAVMPEFYTVTPDIATAIADSAAWDIRKQKGETKAPVEKYQYERSASPWYYIGYNLRKPIFQDKLTRQALSCLTDRQRILTEVFYNLGTIVDGPFTSNSPYADSTVKPFDFAPSRAATLLKDAGWADTDHDGILERTSNGKVLKLSFNLMVPQASPTMRKVTSIVQADLRKAGIDMQIKPLEWSVFVQRLDEQSFDSCILGWTGTLEPDPFQIWHGSQADIKKSSNHIGFKNKRTDELIELGRRTIDKKQRTEYYREFYRIIQEEQPYTFLIAPTALRAQSVKFRNAQVYTLGMDTDHLQWIPQQLQGN